MSVDILDYWSNDNFEDEVASALISVYETKLRKNKGAGPNMLREKHLKFFRNKGAYLPSNSRIVVFDEECAAPFDVRNDTIPLSGCVGFSPKNTERVEGQYNGHFGVYYFERCRLPKSWLKVGDGKSYKMTKIFATNKGIEGENTYFTISENGEIVGCDEIAQAHGTTHFGGPHLNYRRSIECPNTIIETAKQASYATQIIADRRFCWSIRAEESIAKVTLGCMREEVKSLLYARSLPVTSTGRKRPILHLVESHKRRIRNGIDINITPFLRGTPKIEMGGTIFTVIPPTFEKPRLSMNSMKYYDIHHV